MGSLSALLNGVPDSLPQLAPMVTQCHDTSYDDNVNMQASNMLN